jgi:hypothetical protein
MKRLLIFVLFILSMSNTIASVTVTIGTGTNITSGFTSDVTPYKSYWMDGQDQILFTAAELSAAGLGAGNIERLAFNVGSADGATLNSFTISVQQVSATTLSAFLTSGWTTCYTSNVVATVGWNTYIFTTPFNWNGTSSLVFKVCFNNSGYTTNSHVYYTTTPYPGVHYYWANDLETSSGCDVTSASGGTYRPNVRITGQPNATPILSVTPAALDFGDVFTGNTSAELSYSLTGSNLTPVSGSITVTPPPAFEVSRSAGGPYSSSPITVTYTGGTLSSTIYAVFKPTIANTFYSGNIANSGGGATTVNVAVTGHSPCVALSMPYCQDFPDASMPSCWFQTYSSGLGSDRWTFENSTIAGGTAYEALCTYTSGSGTSRLISPPLLTNGLTSIHLAFRQMFDDYTIGADVTIMVQTRISGGAWVTQWSHAGGVGSNIAAELTEMDIPVSGSVIEFAWTVEGNHYDFDYWYIDEVCVSVPLLHDVQTLSIDDVPGIIPTGTTLTPKATVKNSGTTSPETFNVTMTASGGYSSTVTGVSLASGAQTQVTFANWTPPYGNYTVQVCTQLGSDLNTANDCKSRPIKVKSPTKMYCYVAAAGTSGLSAGPAWFYDTDPGTITSLAATTSTNFICAGTWANGTWYGSEYWDATALTGGGWYTLNPATGAMAKLADLGRSFTGITYDLTANIMYGVDYNTTTLYNDLYTIVPATGVATLIGSIGYDELLINLATDGTGYLYSIGIGADHLYKINPTGPVLTDVGACGISMNYGQDMEYDQSSNTLYAAAYTSSGGLYTVNMTTGACTLVSTFMGGAEITGFAVPYCVDNNQWTGNISTDWTNPANWTCGLVPGVSDNVFISISPSGGNFPVINTGVTANCFNIFVAPGADVKVKTGGTLHVINP